MTRTTSQSNSKGGVAKTTSTVQLAHEYASLGRKVLIIDADSQKSATKNLGIDVPVGSPTVYAVLTEPNQGIARAIKSYKGTSRRPVAYPGQGKIDIIPGAKQVTDAPAVFDKSRDRQPVPSFEHVLPYIIAHFCQDYDEVLIDPSPAQDRITRSCILAADTVIAPVAAEPMALDGVQELLASLREANESRVTLGLTGRTRLAGLLICKVYPDQMEIVDQLRAALDASNIPHFGQAYIPYTTAGWKSPAERLPIAVYQSDDAAAHAYHAIMADLAA